MIGFADIGPAVLRYRVSGDPTGPWVVFVNSLGTDLTIWDAVIERLPRGYAVLGYDFRGHGLSSLPDGPLSMDDHASDLLALMDRLGIGQAVICGVSIGGMIAQAAAARAPGRVRGLVLCNTAARIGTVESWSERIEALSAAGLDAVADMIMENWFTAAFRAGQPVDLAGYRAMLARTPLQGYIASCVALRDADLTASTATLEMPVLCIAGAGDPVTTTEMVRALAALIPGAEYLELADCGHIPPVEQPGACADAITGFLADLDGHGLLSQPAAMTIRRQVLGDAHVDRAEAARTAFDDPFQRFITASAWGGVWASPYLTRRERSIVTLALLAALGQDDEVAMHVRAARNTGASRVDIREAFMHVAVYAGVPRANHALKIAKAVFAETDGEG